MREMRVDEGVRKVREAHKSGGDAAALKVIMENVLTGLDAMEADLNAGRPVKETVDNARTLVKHLIKHYPN